MVPELPFCSGKSGICSDGARDDGTREVRPDLAYRRLGMVNVTFFGLSGAGDRAWVLVDTGSIGTMHVIIDAAAVRFGKGARPNAIIQTHGHFDHVGSLEALAQCWDVPVYAHKNEHRYLNGNSSYPPPDPKVGGGLMSMLSPLYPWGRTNVGNRLRCLPEDGSVPGMAGWRWVHTPGHTPGHISLWRDADRSLIAGDAFLTTDQESVYGVAVQKPKINGPPEYYTSNWIDARKSVELLSSLEPELAISGHGPAMLGENMRENLRLLASNFT